MPEADSDAVAEAHRARLALDRLLETDAPSIAALVPAGFADSCERYVALLLAANRRTNLTRLTDAADVARLHVLDSLSALPEIDAAQPARALDLGTGGGVPGLVLALARPRVRWTLIDSVGKKAEAVRGFATALGASNVTVVAARAEELGRDPQHRETHDLVTARACAPLPVLVEYALPLLRIGGALVAWKGPLRDEDDEVRRGRAAASRLGGGDPRIVEPETSALGAHRLIVIRKQRPTPAGFPRRPGEPARRPLA